MLEKNNIINEQELHILLNSKYQDDYPGLNKAMNIPQFTISDLGVTARDATYWAKKDILPKLIVGSTTRRKYTLKQAVWIKLIQQLRSFDVSLNQIKKIKNHLLTSEISFKEVMASEQVKFILEKLAEKDGSLEEYKNIIHDPSFIREMEKNQIDVFELMVLYAIIFRRDVSYMVSVDGECLPYIYDKHELIKKNVPGFEEYAKSPHLLLSLSNALSHLIEDWSEKKWFNKVSIVSKDEMKILELIRNKSIKELRIMKNNDEVDRLIVIEDKKLTAIEEFAKHIVKNGYQTITISTRNGKPVHFKNEVSVKLKDIPE